MRPKTPGLAVHTVSLRRRVALIVAVADNGVIGREGQLLWRLPGDLARFKRLTLGCPIVMGRKTFESIGRPLPGRVSIVLTRDPGRREFPEGVVACGDLRDALRYADDCQTENGGEVFVIGGGEVYRLALPFAQVAYVTRVRTQVEGDATFPALNPKEWRLVSSDDQPADETNEIGSSLEVWERTLTL